MNRAHATFYYDTMLLNLLPSNQPGPIHSIPSDSLSVIFNVLITENQSGILAPALVNKQWRAATIKVLSENLKNKNFYLPKFAFGPQRWASFFGEKTPSDEEIQTAFSILPANIHEKLNSLCPVFSKSGKLVKDTHLLVYISNSINKTEFNLTTLGSKIELNLQPEIRKVAGYKFILDQVLNDININKPTNQPYWVLMVRDVLTDSKNISKAQQDTMIQNLVANSGIAYEISKTIEAVAVTIANLVITKEYLFGINSYIRCEESIGPFQVVVGGCDASGINVKKSRNVHIVHTGTVVLMKFY